ncbi:hypothetical protein ACIQMV_36615 [Streptomyces sp. NPDC091412]|uniref:hypothetical protein n=1 Tax=Streptomyces sp. NPDC091412 TaxID=3366002 RepID=UPI0037FBA38B
MAQLAAEHAAHERAAPQPTDLARRLETLLFATETPRLRCFVAALNEEEITGYASCAPEVSTGDEAAAALSSTPEDTLAQVHPGSIVMSARGGGVDADQRQVHLTPLRGFCGQALQQDLEDGGLTPLPHAVVDGRRGTELLRHRPPLPAGPEPPTRRTRG